MKENYIRNYILESVNVKEEILSSDLLVQSIKEGAEIIIRAYKNGNKIITAGNGGSAADAQHIAAELVSKFLKDRPALNALALTTNTSILTAIGNDYSHEYIFARQIQAYGREGDVYIPISTSGNSKNIIKSIEEAKMLGLKVVGLTGKNPCLMDNLCDLIIKIPSDNTPIIQEAHITIGHILCAIVERELCV